MLAEPVPLVIRNAPTKLMAGTALWGGISVRPQHRGKADQYAVPAGFPFGEELLPANGTGAGGAL